MEEAVERRVFPGGVLLVAERGQVLFSEAFGMARLVPPRPMKEDTRFDLASLTKPLATAVSVMVLVQEEILLLDQTLGTTLEEFTGTEKQDVTIRQLLSHTSGLPDYRPYYRQLIKVPFHERKSVVRRLLLKEDLIYDPGKVCLYLSLIHI